MRNFSLSLYKEKDNIIRMSVEIPDGWGANFSAISYSYGVKYGKCDNSEFRGFKDDLFFKKEDISDLYYYISHPENWSLDNQFTKKSEIDGNVYRMSAFPLQQNEQTNLVLKFVRYIPEKATGIIILPPEHQKYFRQYLAKFIV